MKASNGGSAFPVSFAYAGESESIHISAGMTLRDYFASKALQGLMHYAMENGSESKEMASAAYLIADDMLRARGDA